MGQVIDLPQPRCPWCDMPVNPNLCQLCGGKLSTPWEEGARRRCLNCGEEPKTWSVQMHNGREWHSGCWEDHKMDEHETFITGPDGDG